MALRGMPRIGAQLAWSYRCGRQESSPARIVPSSTSVVGSAAIHVVAPPRAVMTPPEPRSAPLRLGAESAAVEVALLSLLQKAAPLHSRPDSAAGALG